MLFFFKSPAKQKIKLFVVFLISNFSVFAQNLTLSGKIINEKDQEPLIGVNVLLTSLRDSTQKRGVISDVEGNFIFNNLQRGRYQLRLSYTGYETQNQIVFLNETKQLGNIVLKEDVAILKEVKIEGKQMRVEMKDDTAQFNANAYKTNPDATAEELVTKMPGITTTGGVVKAQGENVKRVLLDGQEFFGDDATLALRNLPAEIVDKIQVFDRASDQSRFTGFNDGNTEKTINIITKQGMNTGQFGKIYAGYGTNERYQAGGSINFFKGKRRISLIGMANNINQQNFGEQDLLGVLGGDKRGSGGRRFRSGAEAFSPSSPDNFMVGQQNGINTTNSIGINYSDKLGQKTVLSGSYFYNNTQNDVNSQLQRQLFLRSGGNQLYDESYMSLNKNDNHRLNFRLDYQIDSVNSFIITPRVRWQGNKTDNRTIGENYFTDTTRLNNTNTLLGAAINGYNIANDFLLRHKFKKERRTISANINTEINESNGNNNLNANNYFFLTDSTDIISQRANALNNGYKVGLDLQYTEPVAKKGQLMLNYTPSFQQDKSNNLTQRWDKENNSFSVTDSLLSNQFQTRIFTQRAGGSYRSMEGKQQFMVGLYYQQTQLIGNQFFPLEDNIQRPFHNVLPMAMYRYTFSKSATIRMFYRTSTSLPSVSQLQNVVNNSNPLQLSTGNPNLKQELTHFLVVRYSTANLEKANSTFAYIRVRYTDNYIARSTFIANNDTTLASGLALKRGTQLSIPVNLKGYVNVSSLVTHSFPLTFIKSNLNLDGGVTYVRNPGLVNQVENISTTYNTNGSIIVSSNISEKIDFTASYNANYNIVTNSLQPQLNNNYFFQTASARFNGLFWKKLVLSTDLNYTAISGLGADFNQDFLLWNAAIGYKFLKNNAGEVRLNVFDMLKQNNNIRRNVTETYIDDSRFNVLQRFAVLTFIYQLRNFTKNKE